MGTDAPIALQVNWAAFRLEAMLIAAMGVILVADIIRPRLAAWMAGWLLLLVAVVALADCFACPVSDASLWDGFYVVDPMARFFKALFLLGLTLVTLASLKYTRDKARRPEFFLCLGASTVGMMILASATELIVLFVALELASISLYLLVSILREEGLSREAGLKYLLIGAFSSALFLFGASLVYAASGTTAITGIAAFAGSNLDRPLLLVGMILILAAVGFKIAAVPFHMWAPDVYQGAPTPAVAFASTASKAAGFVIMIRLIMGALGSLSEDWMLLLTVIAALTMTVGSFLAIPQTNIKRLLAYSSIAQAGYLLVGFVAGSERGLSAVLFYLLVYMFTNVGVFTVVIVIARNEGSDDLGSYEGLAQRAPLLALTLMLCLLSLAGIPPLGGFVGKLYLFAAAMEFRGRLLWLVVLAIVLSIVSLYYYLLVIRRMYIEPPRAQRRIIVGPTATIAMLICLAGVAVTGIMPGRILSVTIEVARSFLKF